MIDLFEREQFVRLDDLFALGSILFDALVKRLVFLLRGLEHSLCSFHLFLLFLDVGLRGVAAFDHIVVALDEIFDLMRSEIAGAVVGVCRAVFEREYDHAVLLARQIVEEIGREVERGAEYGQRAQHIEKTVAYARVVQHVIVDGEAVGLVDVRQEIAREDRDRRSDQRSDFEHIVDALARLPLYRVLDLGVEHRVVDELQLVDEGVDPQEEEVQKRDLVAREHTTDENDVEHVVEEQYALVAQPFEEERRREHRKPRRDRKHRLQDPVHVHILRTVYVDPAEQHEICAFEEVEPGGDGPQPPVLVAPHGDAAADDADLFDEVLGRDDALLASEECEEAEEYAEDTDRYDDEFVCPDVGESAGQVGEYRDEKLIDGRRERIDQRTDGEHLRAFGGAGRDDAAEVGICRLIERLTYRYRDREHEHSRVFVAVRHRFERQKDENDADDRKRRAHYRQIWSEPAPSRVGVVDDLAANDLEDDVEDRLHGEHVLQVHRTYADGRREQRVGDAESHISEQIYEHVLTHSTDGVVEDLLVRDVIALAGFAPVRGDVRDDERGGVFDLGNAFVDLAFDCACHNLPRCGTTPILTR